MRYAFLTPEFPTTLKGAGGLSTYTERMACLLAENGFDVEVFVLTNTSKSFEYRGLTVHHVVVR